VRSDEQVPPVLLDNGDHPDHLELQDRLVRPVGLDGQDLLAFQEDQEHLVSFQSRSKINISSMYPIDLITAFYDEGIQRHSRFKTYAASQF